MSQESAASFCMSQSILESKTPVSQDKADYTSRKTWRLPKHRMQKFRNKILYPQLRQIHGIFWPDVIRNEELW